MSRMISVLAVVTIGIALVTTGCSSSSTTPTAEDAKETPSITAAATWDDIADVKIKRRGDDVVVVDLRDVPAEQHAAAMALLSKTKTTSELFVPAAAWTDDTTLRLAALPALKRLRVYGTEFGDEQAMTLSGLPALQAVTMQGTSVTDQGAGVLAEMIDLREVSLMNSPVTDAVLQKLSTLPKLVKLRLRGTQITGEDFGPIAKLPLVDLELAETAFGSAGMPAVASIAGLQKLNLWMTKVDDAGLAAIDGKKTMTLLNLDNCAAITDASIPVITSLPKLTLLHLGGTGLSPDALPQLQPLQNLETLFVTRLGLEAAAAETLKTMFPKLERFEF